MHGCLPTRGLRFVIKVDLHLPFQSLFRDSRREDKDKFVSSITFETGFLLWSGRTRNPTFLKFFECTQYASALDLILLVDEVFVECEAEAFATLIRLGISRKSRQDLCFQFRHERDFSPVKWVSHHTVGSHHLNFRTNLARWVYDDQKVRTVEFGDTEQILTSAKHWYNSQCTLHI